MEERTRGALRAAAVASVWVGVAGSASACESCRAALASGQDGFARGINQSILFMIAAVAAVFGTFGFLVWNSYRLERTRGSAADAMPAGRIRWSAGGDGKG